MLTILLILLVLLLTGGGYGIRRRGRRSSYSVGSRTRSPDGPAGRRHARPDSMRAAKRSSETPATSSTPARIAPALSPACG